MRKPPHNLVLYALLALALAGLAYSIIVLAGAPSITQQPALEQRSQTTGSGAAGAGDGQHRGKPISSGTTGAGDVQVQLTPLDVENGRLKVEISANTHSVDLGEVNLQEQTILEFAGDTLKPASAPRLSGHHASGVLEFETGGEISAFTIRIRGIPLEEERVFAWG